MLIVLHGKAPEVFHQLAVLARVAGRLTLGELARLSADSWGEPCAR